MMIRLFTKMVSNLYLNNSLKFVKNFMGTFSCDAIPKFKLTYESIFMIVNLDTLDQRGSHFVYMELTKRKAYFWDPFGHCLTNNYIRKS